MENNDSRSRILALGTTLVLIAFFGISRHSRQQKQRDSLLGTSTPGIVTPGSADISDDESWSYGFEIVEEHAHVYGNGISLELRPARDGILPDADVTSQQARLHAWYRSFRKSQNSHAHSAEMKKELALATSMRKHNWQAELYSEEHPHNKPYWSLPRIQRLNQTVRQLTALAEHVKVDAHSLVCVRAHDPVNMKTIHQAVAHMSPRPKIMENTFGSDCSFMFTWTVQTFSNDKAEAVRGLENVQGPWLVWEKSHFRSVEYSVVRAADYANHGRRKLAAFQGKNVLNKLTWLGWNGLNGYGIRPKNMPPDRWNQVFAPLLQVAPWKEDRQNLTGAIVLVMGQYAGDTNMAPVYYNFGGPEAWYETVVEALFKLDLGLEVRFRPSPRAGEKRTHGPGGSILSRPGTPLADDLAAAYCVIVLNSASSVDAILSGTPVIAMDEGNMAWDVSSHDINDIRDHKLARPDRTQWLYDMAYSQWTAREVGAGDWIPYYFDPSIMG